MVVQSIMTHNQSTSNSNIEPVQYSKISFSVMSFTFRLNSLACLQFVKLIHLAQWRIDILHKSLEIIQDLLTPRATSQPINSELEPLLSFYSNPTITRNSQIFDLVVITQNFKERFYSRTISQKDLTIFSQ